MLQQPACLTGSVECAARHVLIVFGQEIRDEKDAVIMGPHHRRLRDLIAQGDIVALTAEIPGHILRLRGARLAR